MSRQFTTVVLPAIAVTEGPEAQQLREAVRATRRGYGTFVQTVYAETLSTAADIAFGSNWRRYRVVRAPDILHVLLNPPGPIDKKRPGVLQALAFLRKNTTSVTRLPSSITINHIVSALAYLNTEWRDNQELPPAKRSILVFRMVHDEPRARFLTSLFAQLGAHPHHLPALLNAADTDEAVDILARVLNETQPGRNAMFRKAPDIIVFVLPSGFPPKTRSRIPFDEHLEFNNLFSSDALGKKLRPIADRRWASQLNRTRILIVSDSHLSPLLADGLEPDRREQNIYRQLAIFRFGFTYAMAQAVVGAQPLEQDLRSWLDAAVRSKALFYVGGQYFLAPATRRSVRQNRMPPAEFARAHMAASLACAPYLNGVTSRFVR